MVEVIFASTSVGALNAGKHPDYPRLIVLVNLVSTMDDQACVESSSRLLVDTPKRSLNKDVRRAARLSPAAAKHCSSVVVDMDMSQCSRFAAKKPSYSE